MLKKVTKISLIAAVLFVSLFSVSCTVVLEPNTFCPNDLVGTWRSRDSNNTFIIASNGYLTISIDGVTRTSQINNWYNDRYTQRESHNLTSYESYLGNITLTFTSSTECEAYYSYNINESFYKE